MTPLGWIQILLYCAIIVAITPVLGAYMTRVFSGERIRRNLWIYGVGGVIIPFIGIKAIDVVVTALHLA